MSVIVLLEINVKPENADEVTAFFRDELHRTRGFDGCNGITIHRNQDDPNTLVAVEDWDSRQHYEKYLAWRTERGDLNKLVGWLQGDPSIRYFDNVGV